MPIPQTRFIVNAAGEKTGVLLSIKQYEKLLADLHELGRHYGASRRGTDTA